MCNKKPAIKMVKTALNDSTILIKPSRKLIDYINTVTVNADMPEGVTNIHHGCNKTESITTHKNNTLNLTDVNWLYERAAGGNAYFHELFEGSEIVLPENERRELESQEENEMTKDNTRSNPEDSLAFQIKRINRQLLVVVQFIASIVAGFLFGFLGMEVLIGTLNLGFRLLTGIFCAVIVALAELYFLVRRLNEDLMSENHRAGRYSIKFE